MGSPESGAATPSAFALNLGPWTGMGLIGPLLPCGEFYSDLCCQFKPACSCIDCCVFDCPRSTPNRRTSHDTPTAPPDGQD